MGTVFILGSVLAVCLTPSEDLQAQSEEDSAGSDHTLAKSVSQARICCGGEPNVTAEYMYIL